MQIVSKREDGSLRVQTLNDEADMCKQSFKDECDINFILRDYGRTGVVRHLNEARARYMDVSEVGDYESALLTVKAAEEQFMSLPAKVRKVFRNSPAEFLDAAHHPEKRKLLEEAGLLPAEKPQDVVKPASEGSGSPNP